MIVSFAALGAFVMVVGIGAGYFAAAMAERQAEQLAGSLVSRSVTSHLRQLRIEGATVDVAPVPSEVEAWDGLRTMLGGMVGAVDVDVLTADGSLALGDEADEAYRHQVSPAVWRQVMAGAGAQELLQVDDVARHASGYALYVLVPVTFVGTGDVPQGKGAIAVEVDGAKVAATYRQTRNVAFAATGFVQVVLFLVLLHLAQLVSLRGFRDAVTELPNRKYFVAAAEGILANDIRHGRTAALLYADINRFSQVNASFGHRAGDEVLRKVAEAISKRVRRGDVVARVGGDQFAVLLDQASASGAKDVAEAITTSFETATVVDDHRMRTSLSIGIALFPQHGRTTEMLLRCADAAAGEAKTSKAGVVTYTLGRGDLSGASLALESDLRDALTRQEIDVHFQPIVRGDDGRVVGYEALARWSRDGNPVSPGEFIPVAESTGLIRRLDRYIVDQAVRLLAALRLSEPRTRVSINLSASSLSDPALPAYMQDVSEHYRVPPHRIMLEVTEGVAIESASHASNVLERLRSMGYLVALDDFGTGYSSLAYLKSLPVDVVKIDRQFVSGIGRHDSDETLIRAVVEYAHSLRLQVVAEGVETAAQHVWLQDQKVELEQGYLHGRPAAVNVDAEAVAEEPPNRVPLDGDG